MKGERGGRDEGKGGFKGRGEGDGWRGKEREEGMGIRRGMKGGGEAEN